MALGAKYPNITQGLRLINSSDVELAAYLANPKTVCTFFAPSNTAMTESIRRLGKYAGIAAQNESMQEATFNYHGELASMQLASMQYAVGKYAVYSWQVCTMQALLRKMRACRKLPSTIMVSWGSCQAAVSCAAAEHISWFPPEAYSLPSPVIIRSTAQSR
jgi:hypothetical protein